MNRHEEIDYKHGQIRTLLLQHHAKALWLRRSRNLFWFTAGADPSIPTDSEMGMYSIVITPEHRIIYTDNIEVERMKGEEHFEALGFEYVAPEWHTNIQPPQFDDMLVDDDAVDAALLALRSVLNTAEQERFRELGRDAAAALEEAARAVQAGDTEFEMAARLDAAARKRGGVAVVNLIATDERISNFRHPLATDKRLEKYGMIIICMRRGGLIVAGTRLVHIGAVPDELTTKLHKVAAIDTAAMVASRPGRTLGEVFDDLRAAYAVQGETDQWRHHHQGGTIAYNSREIIAKPGSTTRLTAGHALAWNPSIVGCKSEDTILIHDDGFEIVTETSANWPMVTVEMNGQVIQRPGILEL